MVYWGENGRFLRRRRSVAPAPLASSRRRPLDVGYWTVASPSRPISNAAFAPSFRVHLVAPEVLAKN